MDDSIEIQQKIVGPEAKAELARLWFLPLYHMRQEPGNGGLSCSLVQSWPEIAGWRGGL